MPVLTIVVSRTNKFQSIEIWLRQETIMGSIATVPR